MLTGVKADDVNAYIISGKAAMLEKIKAMDKNSFDIMTLPAMPQFRTIRRIVGECDFCGESIDRSDHYFQKRTAAPGDIIRIHEDCLLDYISRRYKLADIASKMGFEEVAP